MKKIKIYLLLLPVLLMQGCFDLDEHPYNLVDKNTYYKNENSLKGVVAGIYSVAFNNNLEELWCLQEMPADQITTRCWNGGSYGWDEGKRYVLSTHTWNESSTILNAMWGRCWEAIGLCNTAVADFEALNPASVGITRERLDFYIAEVKTMRVWCYSKIFDLWGGAIPLATSTTGSVPGSADTDFDTGCQIIWKFLVDELDEAVNDLPKNEINRMNQAANRILKARLLINANVYVKEDKFAECATLCQEILSGKYGNYEIAGDYTKIYSHDNHTCNEIVWSFACDPAQLKPNWLRNSTFLPDFMTGDYFNSTGFGYGGWNCALLVPSYDNAGSFREGTGTPRSFLSHYGDKLGAVYERYDDRDIRKKNHVCDESGNWSGMFLNGAMKKNYGTGGNIDDSDERSGLPLVYVDQVGTFLGRGRQLEDVMSPRWGEANSGVRLVRYPMYPQSSGLHYCMADEVEIRLAEVVYMLAECKMRAGDSNGAKELVNGVRQRYYTAADWNTVKELPGPGFSAFDLDWMLSEWGLEFLNEGNRRRTDLRRFDKFTQGQWWFFGRTSDDGVQLPAKRDRKYEWYPLPNSALDTNPNLSQNPAYL